MVSVKFVRHTLNLQIFIGLLYSCKNSDSTNALNDAIVKQKTETTEPKSRRQTLIEELKRLQSVLASNDKEQISGLFSFPLTKEVIGIYIDDSAFNAELNKNNNILTKRMFIRFYQDISESLEIEQMNQLFRKLNIDNLLHKDSLHYEAIKKTEPCYKYYTITVGDNLVTLTLGMNSNRDFESIRVAEDETPENDSSICEHLLEWRFTFDGKKLQFTEIAGAG